MPKKIGGAEGGRRRRVTGAMARKPWEEAPPKRQQPKKSRPKPSAPEPASAPAVSRRRRATGAMAQKPWAEAPKKRVQESRTEPEPEPEPEPELPFAEDEVADDDTFAELEPEGEPLPSTVAQWAQLSLVQQTAASLLGFSAARWPAPEHLAVVEKMWVELSKEERVAAQVLCYTQDLWDAVDSDDDADIDVCKSLSLGQWLDQQGLSHTEQIVSSFVTDRAGTQLEALRDLLVEDLDELVSSMALEGSLEGRFRDAVANLRPHQTKTDIDGDADVMAATHRLQAVDNHAAWFVAERDTAATKLQARWRGRMQRKVGLPKPQPVEWTAETRAKIYNEVGGMSKEDQEALLEKMEAEGEWVVRDRDLRNYLMEQKAMGHLHTKKSKQVQEIYEAKKTFAEDVDGAATKLQAQWRGYRVRKARETAAEEASAAMWGVMDASGKFRRRRELTIENKRRAAATRVQSTYRGHVARSYLRKRRHEEALRTAISHEDDHKEFGSILYTLERAATVDEPVEKSAHAKAHLAALNSKAVHEAARNTPWLSKEARQAFKKGRAQQRPQSAEPLGLGRTTSRRSARRSRRERPASAFARPRDVVLNLDRTSDAVTWATMNGIQIPPKLAPLGNSTAEQYTSRSQGAARSTGDQTMPDGEQLCHAAWKGDVDAVCRLLWNGVDVNSREKSDSTSLLLATAAGNDEVVEVLLGCGADTEHADSEGRNALQLAAKYGRKKCIELLLVANADVNVASVEDGITPFHLACVAGHSETVSLLLANGADPRAKTHNDMTGGQLLIEKHEREKERKDEVLKMVKEENYPQEMSTQSDISLLGDAGRKEAEKMRVKVELAEFRDEFMSVKQDMLGMKRQLSGMIGQLNGFGGAITELAERSTQSVAAVVRIAPSGDNQGSLRPQSAAPIPSSFMASSTPVSQERPYTQTRPHSAMAALRSKPSPADRGIQVEASTTGNADAQDSWSVTEEWEQSRRPQSATSSGGNFGSRPPRGRLRPATAGPVGGGMSAIGENLRPPQGMGLERPQLPQRPHSALPYAQSYPTVGTPPQRPGSAHGLARPGSAASRSSRPGSSGGDRPVSAGGVNTRPSSGSSNDNERSSQFDELERQAHDISEISSASTSISRAGDEWQSPEFAPRQIIQHDSPARPSGVALLAEAERSAQFNQTMADPPGSEDKGDGTAIDRHGLVAQVLLGGQAAAKRKEANRPYARPLSSVSESSLGQQDDDDGDIEFVGTGKTVTEVLAIADRSAIVDPLEGAASRKNTWNQAEMTRLSMAVKLKGENDWEKVASIVSTGAVPRTASECADAWERNMDQYTTQGQWIGYTSSDRPPPGADAAALEGMIASVRRQLEKNPDNTDLQELLQNMQRMLFESIHIDKEAEQARSDGQPMAVAPSPAQATHDWVEAERIKASYENGGGNVDYPGVESDGENSDERALALAQQRYDDPPQTRSELIHAALSRDCTHKMGPAEKSVVFESTGGEWYCDGCGEQNPAGRLFQCRVCNEYDLCTQCMRGQGRETEVLFNRLNLGGSMAAGALGGATAAKQIRKKESYEEREAEKARLRKAVEELEDMQNAAREERQAERRAAAAARKQTEIEQEATRKRRWMS